MNRMTKLLVLCMTTAAFAACGGAAKTSKAGMSKIAGDAPPPPTGENKKLDRKVSKAASSEFKEAVEFYNNAKKDGWTADECNEASSKFAGIADSYGKMIEARFNAGLALQNCGMNKEAEAHYNKALKLNPGHAPSISNLGEIYFKGGNEARAKQYWEQAVKADGKIVAARNNLAWLLIRDIRDGKASLKSTEPEVKKQLSSALAVDNDNVESYTLYSLLYMEGSKKNKSRLTLAKLLLEKGAEINPNYAPLHNARGLLQLKQDNVPQALESFRRASQLDPKFLEARRNVGNIVLDFRKYDEAKVEFEAVLKLNPKDYDALIGLGYAQRGLKEFDAAEATYKQAAKLDGKRAEADYNLGVLYQDFRSNATEDLKMAQKHFKTASGYFNKAMSKPTASAELKKEAKENIKACDKNVKSLKAAIEFQEQMKADQ